MGDIFFVIKISVITLVLIFLMQIKIGEDTLENRALFALRESPFSGQVQELGAGGWKELRKTIARAARGLGDTFSHREDRLDFFNFGRSQARVDEEAKKAESTKQAPSADATEDGNK
ncbi:MAG: hypothetical protein ABL958_09905 [Bdellovibrionia bacterium]